MGSPARVESGEPEPLKIAVRGFTEWDGAKERRAATYRKFAGNVLILDTETRISAAQNLTFGSYRLLEAGQCTEEGLFYGDDLTPKEMACLHEYVRSRDADVAPGFSKKLLLYNQRDFLRLFYEAAFRSRFLVVAFNLPFDLSRLAFDVASARDEFAGGFSLMLWQRPGSELENKYRPRFAVKHIDSKRALKGFTKPVVLDYADRIPEGSKTGKPDKRYTFRGHFLDLRTLAFALTDRGHSLKTACEAFGVEHGKTEPDRHGIVTPEYIDYNRRDVLATTELYFKLMEEYERHPIPLQATRAFSPASIGKAYERAMSVVPPTGPAARL